MTEPFLPDEPRELLADLCRLVRDRASSEVEIGAGLAAEREAAEQSSQSFLESLTKRYRAEKTAAEKKYVSSRGEILARFESESKKIQREYDSVRQQAIARFGAAEAAAQKQLTDKRWEATAMAEAAVSGSSLQADDIVSGLESRWNELHEIHKQAVELLQYRGQWRDFPDDQPTALLLENNLSQRFIHALETAHKQYKNLARQFLWRFVQGLWPLAAFLLLWSAAIGPAIYAFGWKDWRWAASSGGAAFVVFITIGIWLSRFTNRRAADAYLALRHTLLEAGGGRPAVLEDSKKQCQRLHDAIDLRQNAETRKAEEKFNAAMAEIENRKQQELQKIDAAYPARLAELAANRDRCIEEIENKYPRLLEELDSRFAAESKRLGDEHVRSAREIEERWNRRWTDMSDRWLAGIAQFRAGIEHIDRACRDSFPDWHTEDWSRWSIPTSIPDSIWLGSGKLELARIEGGLPTDEKLLPAQTEFNLPVIWPFPQKSLLLWKAGGPGLNKAVESMQAVMLRLLTSMPPGKVRYTIIDPVGLGENFSAFMHLADYDEQLVASRIWTDTPHIEGRLADLTKHMENVIQVYLRQEFQSIQEYNASAGELAEPYRVLVVANYPANFSEVAAARLKSIIASGTRCGVLVLMSIDAKLQQFRQFQLSDLEPSAQVLRWDREQFVWEHPQYGPVPLALDFPPESEHFREIVRKVGDLAKDSGRVEVPFSCIIPEEDKWWSADSRSGIDVPLGRAGAMKFQNLDLGRGTSQHVLISGKTGSGKSTLLHVLITNLALRYSPDQVELYLVDFKKGVEFKAYARGGLPHARVIAIESEREFGLSVLQRLDAEMRERGDLFRKQGVQDIRGFRMEQPAVRMPRILLIIDEFQELFTEDDRLAQESALLLDRLVRQGRAFGIHVLLGSQTLGGAYSLARSTIGQMAVRIALQCSESDAHLILSEDNTAARLLTRPGEAIYNDANGLYEGNHPFQVVWLPDGDRDKYLEQIGKLAAQKGCNTVPAIVFEGNSPADPNENLALKELLSGKGDRTNLCEAPFGPSGQIGPVPFSTPRAWLGAAVAIKDPTSVAFLSQNGANLLLVGHREQSALGIMANCMISLAAHNNKGVGSLYFQREGSDTKKTPDPFYLLDGLRGDSQEAGFWDRVMPAMPPGVKIAQPRDTAEILAEITAELNLRQEHSQESGPPIYLFLYNLSRFRDLRRDEDFGFSSYGNDKPANPAKQFQNILREGPSLGIHTIVWCDTYNNVTRFLDRQGLRDFEMRVLFQMNSTDSSNLMDTPDASRLGTHTAIYYDEGQGRMEKFRPYGLPSDEWLAWVKTQFNAR
jgi:DNA segregation ATPase FtsK/SpoIIIE, S-DNA-T family